MGVDITQTGQNNPCVLRWVAITFSRSLDLLSHSSDKEMNYSSNKANYTQTPCYRKILKTSRPSHLRPSKLDLFKKKVAKSSTVRNEATEQLDDNLVLLLLDMTMHVLLPQSWPGSVCVGFEFVGLGSIVYLPAIVVNSPGMAPTNSSPNFNT